MTEVVWLLIVFVFLNVLDGFTTWLGIYKLPEGLRGREANVLFKDVEKHFWPAMIKKGAIVLFGVWLFYRFADPFVLKVVDFVLVVVVLNNGYVYLSRRISGKRLRSPVEFSALFFRKLHLPEKASRILGSYTLFGSVIIACYLVAKVVS